MQHEYDEEELLNEGQQEGSEGDEEKQRELSSGMVGLGNEKSN